MYNRYIPQPDGSYQRSRQPDQFSQASPRPCPPAPPVCPDPTPAEPPQISQKIPSPPQHKPSRQYRSAPQKQERPEPSGISVGSFLHQILPKDFDTGDLIVILLLLLMSSDCQEEQNTALLTLALYLFL